MEVIIEAELSQVGVEPETRDCLNMLDMPVNGLKVKRPQTADIFDALTLVEEGDLEELEETATGGSEKRKLRRAISSVG